MKKNIPIQKIIAFTICVSMISSSLITSSTIAYASSSDNPKIQSMPLSPNFVNGGNNSNSSQLTKKVSTTKHKTGLAPVPFELPKVKQSPTFQSTSYPTSYDLRTLGKVTSVKDQSTSGSCWAFATYASVESKLLPNENRDFSENNLKNNSGFDWDPNNGGGQHFMSTAYLARWSGPVNESDDPYNPSSTSSPTNKPIQKHVQEVLWLPDRTGYLDNNIIKDQIMKNGVVKTSMYYEDTSFNDTYDTYYDSYKWGSTNHAVAIVGWDDNFDRNKFVDSWNGAVPPANGAFIVKNSWGTSYGNNGYFYISYYDENVGYNNVVFNGIEPTTNYKTIYQYDPLGLVQNVGYGTESSWFSNVFTSSSSEDLSAVSFYTIVPNTNYEIYVCSNYNSPNDLASKRALKASGSISFAGYHTINLNSLTTLNPGEKFAVIVKVTTPGFTYQIPVEYAYPGYSGSATSSAGQSFVSSTGNTWNDLTTGYNSSSNVCLKAFTNPSTTPIVNLPSVSYQGHVQNIGWQNWVKDGALSGTEGQSLRIEAFKIKLENAPAGLRIKYKTHVQNIGWQDWVYDGAMAGTQGQALRVEALQIMLEGTNADQYSVQYQAHVQNEGWQPWFRDGQIAGSIGKSQRIEAIRIKITKKIPSVSYQGHVQNIGWQNWVKDGALSGTEGQALRVEAFKIKLENAPAGLRIKYKTHVQNIGWQDWVYDGALSGTEGQSLRVEALQIMLEGTNSDQYSVQYQAHVQNEGWQPWFRDGQISGSIGKSQRIEALRVIIVPK